MNARVKIDEKALAQYAALSMEIKTLEAQRASIKLDIVEEFVAQGVDKMETDLGTFSLTRTRKWRYSKKLTAQEEKLEIARVDEQEKGIAKATITESIRFQQRKESNE